MTVVVSHLTLRWPWLVITHPGSNLIQIVRLPS